MEVIEEMSAVLSVGDARIVHIVSARVGAGCLRQVEDVWWEASTLCLCCAKPTAGWLWVLWMFDLRHCRLCVSA